MKSLTFTLLLVLFTSPYAQTVDETISAHSDAFTLLSTDSNTHVTKFSGAESIRGEIVFKFDMLSPTQVGDLMFVFVVPDKEFISLFPQVVSGFYPRKLEKIEIFNTEETRKMVFGGKRFGGLQDGASRFVSIRGTIGINEYGMSVECDARQYWAKVTSFKAEKDASIQTASKRDVSGC